MSSKSRRPETDQMKFGELRHYLAQPKDLFLTVVRDLFYLPLVLGETVAVPAATPSTNRKLACHPTCNAKLHICTPYTLLESFSPNQIRMHNCIYKQHPWRPQTVGRFVAPTASRTAPRQPPGSQCNPDCTPRNPGHWDPQRRGYSCCSGKHIYVDYEADHNPRDVQLSPWLILTCTLLWTLFCLPCAVASVPVALDLWQVSMMYVSWDPSRAQRVSRTFFCRSVREKMQSWPTALKAARSQSLSECCRLATETLLLHSLAVQAAH